MRPMTKVLVVDDDEVVRRCHLRSLCAMDCVTQGALNGADAIRAMEHDPFDVVLLDIRMPGMDGMSVLKTIKEKWPESEVVIITGYPSIESAKEAVLLGAYDYISKPVGPDEILGAAHGALMHKRWSLRQGPAAERGSVH